MNVIQSTLYCIKTALYIAVTLYITVTGQLPKISSCLNYIFCKVDLYIAVTLYITVTGQLPKISSCRNYILCKVDLYIVVTCRVYNGHLNAISEGWLLYEGLAVFCFSLSSTAAVLLWMEGKEWYTLKNFKSFIQANTNLFKSFFPY